MPPPRDDKGARIQPTGAQVSQYMEDYYDKFLSGGNINGSPIVRFQREVVSVGRGPNCTGWTVCVRDVSTGDENGSVETLYFPRIILCTGVSSHIMVRGRNLFTISSGRESASISSGPFTRRCSEGWVQWPGRSLKQLMGGDGGHPW